MTLAPTDDSEFYKARTTQRQFIALAIRCDRKAVIKSLKTSSFRTNLRPAKNINGAEITKWLVNGWNTESLLRANQLNLEGEALRYSLQWAFPQAYYSVYAIAMAFFKAIGYTESSHAAVIGKIAKEMLAGSYPLPVSFLANGGKSRRYHNISIASISNGHFDIYEPEILDTHICRFLNSTREQELERKKNDLKLKRKDGRLIKRLTVEDWEHVSKRTGPTGILNLLYRKRIKGNYQDIDTFVSEHLDPSKLYSNLICIVDSMNFIHESYIARIVGLKQYNITYVNGTRQNYKFVRARERIIQKL